MKSGTRLQIVLRSLAAPLVITVLLMVSAGRWDYWEGWLYILLNLVIMAANLVILRGSPDLVEERLTPGKGMKSWDLAYLIISTLLYLASLVVAGLDVGRFGWSGRFSSWMYDAAILVYLLGNALFLWAKKTNRFFSSVVRLQVERGQTVVTSGPYRFVRHPGYVGNLLYNLATPLVLGSWWGVILQALACVFLIVRTALEDRLLQKELPGYAEYARQVKYRLLPGIW
jgi:protein-S-isoprenylcysteine O-methyltransferase Ste14